MNGIISRFVSSAISPLNTQTESQINLIETKVTKVTGVMFSLIALLIIVIAMTPFLFHNYMASIIFPVAILYICFPIFEATGKELIKVIGASHQAQSTEGFPAAPEIHET